MPRENLTNVLEPKMWDSFLSIKYFDDIRWGAHKKKKQNYVKVKCDHPSTLYSSIYIWTIRGSLRRREVMAMPFDKLFIICLLDEIQKRQFNTKTTRSVFISRTFSKHDKLRARYIANRRNLFRLVKYACVRTADKLLQLSRLSLKARRS